MNFVPHHGHSSSGIGAALRSSFLKAIVLARADDESLSPLRPMRFGVAAIPTQSPISKGQSPRRFASFLPFQLQGADERGGAGELVEGQQPKRVAHEHTDAGRADARMT